MSSLSLESVVRAWDLQELFEPVSLGNPAAGAALTVRVPGAIQWDILSASFTYTASASAGNRIPAIRFLDAGGIAFADVAAPYKLVASDASRITFGVGVQQFGADSAARIGAGIPRFRLRDGLTVAFTATGIVSGDQISDARIYVRQTPVEPLDVSHDA